MKRRFLLTSELETIKDCYGDLTSKELGRLLNRNPAHIREIAKQYGIKANRRTGRLFTEREKQLLRDRYGISSTKELAEITGRTESSIITKAFEMGLSRRNWAKEEEKILIELYPTHGAVGLIDKLNRPSHEIKKKAKRMGLVCLKTNKQHPWNKS